MLHRADESKKRQLESLLSSCWSVLGELDDLVRRHRRLESERPGVLDKLRFSAKDPSRFRERLVLLVTTIGLFLAGLGTSSLANIEDKLDEIVAEIRNGKRESTTFVFVGENEVSNAQWRRLADELESKDIESEAINANRLGIAAYLHEQIERYELDKSHASDGAMPPEDERLANSGISRRRNHNRDQTNRPELSGFGNARSIVPSLPPTRPLPALPCIPETSSVRSPDLSYTMAMAPPLSRSAGSSYQRSPSGLYETTTETEEYDERGLLRKRTITRHSSTSSFGSSLASTNTSLSLGPSITQTPTDLEAEPECIDFCPDTLAERVTELAERPISLNGPNPPQSPKLSRTSSLNTEFEVWEDETRCLREMLSKQSMQIEQLTRQRDHYKSQLEESGDLQRLQLHRFCSASVSSAFPALPYSMRDPIPHDNLDFRETQHSGEKDYVEKHLVCTLRNPLPERY